MNKFNTLLRVVYTLGLSLMLSQFASAQSAVPAGSVLNFSKVTLNAQSNAGFAVTNPTSTYADVTFTLYGLDGNPIPTTVTALNPIRYRVAPKGQISMLAATLFAPSASVDGWVQVTSPTPGLIGSYLSGDFTTTLQGARSGPGMLTQVVPLIREDSTYNTQLVIVNPNSGTSPATVTIEFYGGSGQRLATTTQSVSAHASVRLRPSSIVPGIPSAGVSARITSSVGVVATAVINRPGTFMFVEGQPVDQPSAVRIVPHFFNAGSWTSTVILTNPTTSAIQVTLTLSSASGGAVDPSRSVPSTTTFPLPPLGSVTASLADIIGRPLFFSPISVDGWLRIDSPNVALDGVVVMDDGQGLTAEPFQLNAQSSALYPEISEDQSTMTGLVLINPSGADATADMYIVQRDGTTLEHETRTIPANSKISENVRDVLPNVVNQSGDYLVITSTTALYSVTMIYQSSGLIAGVSPNAVPASLVPASAAAPEISMISGTDVQSGGTIQVSSTVNTNLTFLIDNQVLAAQYSAPAIPTQPWLVTLPKLDAGYVRLRAHGAGGDSAPILLHVVQPDGSATRPVTGTALYQKIDVTDSGLDLTHPLMFPIRNARVEVFDPSAQAVVSASETDDHGGFSLAVPLAGNLVIRVLSRLQSFDLRVEDNTNLNAIYAIQLPIDAATVGSGLYLFDKSRVSGAYNILEMVQRANDTVKMADPGVQPTPVTIFWSQNNTNRSGNPAQGFIGTSEFNVSNGTAYILGDRSTDSDEYDDSVIVHEYAHMLAAQYSRDDSPGGQHSLGDMLDPRLAWSEGWANFFSSAVRNDPIWRDSMVGPNGPGILRYDLSDSTPTGDPHPGYWSEATVDTLLWALYDGLDADNVQYPISAIWGAFTDLRNNRFVYLPYFLDNFIKRAPSSTSDVVNAAQSRDVNYLPGTVPSVTNPFPMPITVGAIIGPAAVDSASSRRTDLITSAHFYTFTIAGGATTIRMDIVDPGPAGNPNANDLDIFLYNVDGKLLDVSDSGGNGQPERIADRLGAGTYVVEVRSYYTNADTGKVSYNSGDYKLSVSVQ